MRLAEHVVALRLHLAGQQQQVRHRRQEDARRLTRLAGAHEPADRLREEQRRRRAGGVDPDGQPRDVDALGDHAHRDEPTAGARGECRDPVGGARIVGQHHRRRLARESRQQLGVRPGRRLIRGDDHPARIRHVLALLGQPGVGGGDHRGHPFARRIQDRAPGPRRVFGGQRFTESGGMLLARAVPPPRFAGVGQEHDRPDDAVGERLGVAVDVIGLRAREAVGAALVGDERDGAVVAAERRAGQREPARRVAEGLEDRLAPTLRVAAVVDLVEHHERLAVLGAHAVPARVAGHLCIGDDHAVVLVGVLGGRIAELGVEREADACGGRSPLRLEVLGGDDDGDALDGPVGQQFRGDAQREGRLAGARGRDGEEVARSVLQVAHHGATLPAPQSLGAGRCISPHPKTPIWSKGSLGHARQSQLMMRGDTGFRVGITACPRAGRAALSGLPPGCQDPARLHTYRALVQTRRTFLHGAGRRRRRAG